MADLHARTAWDGLGLPLTIGAARVAALPEAVLTSVAPFRGREAEVAAALGAGLPEAGGIAEIAAGRIVWAGIGQWLVQGAAVPDLAAIAAVTDQSDAWAGLLLTGAAAPEVLARLVPVDLDPAVLPPGRVARTMLRHVACQLFATGDGFELLVPRSFARTALHDLSGAMRGVAGRAALAAH